MAMLVQIWNITDAPDSKVARTQVSVYTANLNPGDTIRLPAHMVDERLRKLEEAGYLAIGQLPPWYAASKKRQGRPELTQEELEKKLTSKGEEEPKEEKSQKEEGQKQETDAAAPKAKRKKGGNGGNGGNGGGDQEQPEHLKNGFQDLPPPPNEGEHKQE